MASDEPRERNGHGETAWSGTDVGWMDDGGHVTWMKDSKNEFIGSFCELELSTLTSDRSTTWVDYMNANKIKKEESLVREESLRALEEESN